MITDSNVKGMIIENEFDIEDTVYLKTDSEQLPRLITKLIICSATQIIYVCSCGTLDSQHFAFELSTTPHFITANVE